HYWTGEILFVLVIACYVAVILAVTARRSSVAPAMLAIGTGAGVGLGVVMYAVAPLGLARHATNPWLPGSAADPLVVLEWVGLLGGPLAAGLLAARHHRRLHGPMSPGAGWIRQSTVAGLLTTLVGALLVTSAGTGTIALMPRASWLMHWLYPGQHLAAAAHGHELAASGAAAGYLVLLLAFPVIGLGAGAWGGISSAEWAGGPRPRGGPSGVGAVAGPAGWWPVRRGGRRRGPAVARRARLRGGPHAGPRGGERALRGRTGTRTASGYWEGRARARYIEVRFPLAMDVRFPPVLVRCLGLNRGMTLDFDTCYRAVLARDPRFDGRFYTAVTSTGIYCRPVCPARTPARRNMRFYPHPGAAEAAGFRACRRCRPEASPGSPEWNVRAGLAGRAGRLIADGYVDEHGVDGLARRLAVTERHLRRLLTAELGAGPLALARSMRMQTARRLLAETTMPVTDIAFASGFSSVRQFNATFLESYGQ